MYNMNIIAQIERSMREVGVFPPKSFSSDGGIHRFSTSEDPRDKAGWYSISLTRGISIAVWGCWRTGKSYVVRCDDGRQLTKEEKVQCRRQLERIRKKTEEDSENRAKEAEIEASRIWSMAAPVVEHPYLSIKKVQSYGLRLYENNLIVPVRIDGKITSFQTIDPDGKKLFLFGGKLKSGFFYIGPKELGDIVCVCEGYATAASIHKSTGYPVIITFTAGNIHAICKKIREKLPAIKIVVCADDDYKTKGNPGLTKAKEAANEVSGFLAIPNFGDNRPDGYTDFNDMENHSGSGSVRLVIEAAIQKIIDIKSESESDWADPIPFFSSLPEVIPLTLEMLPKDIRDHVFDVADRQQSPPDFVAVAAICALSSLLGNKVAIYPKQNDDWMVIPTQWGVIIGRPSAMKSPSLKEALKPLYDMDRVFKKEHEENKKKYDAERKLLDIESGIAKSAVKEMIKKGHNDREAALKKLDVMNDGYAEPTRERIIVNDSTVEKLGEILNKNSNGVILIRDELSGFLSNMSKEEYQGDRAFYLECFDGNSSFTYDRIGRGTIDIKSCTLSMVGGIQPSKIYKLVCEAIRGTADDGLIQRLQLAVWPNDIGEWVWQDRMPNQEAYIRYCRIFERFYALERSGDGPFGLRFSLTAQDLYIQWYTENRLLACDNEMGSAFESHLLKMPKTIASLALLFQLVFNESSTFVDDEAMAIALEWADYLSSHARRLYSVLSSQWSRNAMLILSKKDNLSNPFTARDVGKKHWSGLSSIEDVQDALDSLIEYHYLKAEPYKNGGRPSVRYHWNPKLEVNHG